MSKNNGGPAFPVPEHAHAPGIYIGQQEGMTLRDYFAAKASENDVSAIISDHYTAWIDAGEDGSFSPLTRQQARYMHADAMLAEREREK